MIDGDRGHGMVVSPAAMNEAIKRAGEFGIGSVSVMNCRHLGPCAYYAHMALEHGMLGQATTTGGVTMAPTYGAKPLLGLNAMAFAAPTRRNPPFVYDASPSVVAGNKLRLAKRLGQTVLPGWITDQHGNPIMQEAPIPEQYMMLPLGSTREGGSQKGYALSVIGEIVTSVLCASGAGPRRRAGSVHQFLAYDIACFSDPQEFMADLDQYKLVKPASVASTPPVTGTAAVSALPLDQKAGRAGRGARRRGARRGGALTGPASAQFAAQLGGAPAERWRVEIPAVAPRSLSETTIGASPPQPPTSPPLYLRRSEAEVGRHLLRANCGHRRVAEIC